MGHQGMRALGESKQIIIELHRVSFHLRRCENRLMDHKKVYGNSHRPHRTRSGTSSPESELPTRLALPAQPLSRVLGMELRIERQMAALAEQAQVAQLATLRLTAAQMGGGQNHA